MKKLLYLLTFSFMGIFLVSCGNMEESKAKQPVTGLLDNIKNMKISSENLPNYIENYSDQLAPITSFTESSEPGKEDVYKFFFGHMSYKISNINKIDDYSYAIVTSIRNIGSNSFNQRYSEDVSMKALEGVFSQIDPNAQAFTEMDQMKLIEEYNNKVIVLMKDFKFQDSDFLTTEYTFIVKKTEDSEKFKVILDTQESLNNFYMAINPSEPSEEVYFDEEISLEDVIFMGEDGESISLEEITLTE